MDFSNAAYGIYFGVREIKIWELARLQTIVISSMVPMLVFRISADILICTSLCYTLWDYRPHAEARSRKLISTLIVYAMNRFVLTTMIVIAQMVVLITRPASIGAMVIEFVTIHLYINSLLATLNARHRLRGIAESYVSDFELGTRPKSPRSRGQDSSGTGLDIRTASQWTDGSQWTRDSTTRTGHSHSHPHLHSHPELSRLPSGLADLPMTSVASIANVTAEVKTVSSDVRDDWSSSIHSKRKSLT
ncbi:hypothetical protein D9758_009513 [Tetrapyrgos nigripes]|uniref:DUF6534 domain-containing protein n=1 Tax=Tetrapyrgos nigripes TaxID=182062 RepID=A0A8H5G132_9AGAR|nr:hypothetical protein D9758_009513 [Tetrapyrgos nigripes]